MQPEEIAGALAHTFGVTVEAAQKDVRATIELWISMGLIAGSGQAQIHAEASLPDQPPAPDPEPLLPASDRHFESSFSFRLTACAIQIRLPGALEQDRVQPIFSHLEPNEGPPDTAIDVLRQESGYLVLRDGLQVGECSAVIELGPIISQEALRAAYRSNDFLIAVHAGVIGFEGGCIVFPGASGIGKTTLTAGLMTAGFRYFSDETAILDRESLRVIPCPVSLRVKAGSWEIVSAMWNDPLPVCETITVEGIRISYLIPKPGSYAVRPHEALPVRYLVFPLYAAGQPSSLSPVSKAESLRRLQAAGYDMGGELDRDRVARLVEWIEQVDCYEMNYGALPDAISMIQGLVG